MDILDRMENGGTDLRAGGGWPTEGRDAELVTLRNAIAQRSGAVLVGPAGVGKTHLARCIAAEWARHSTVHWVSAIEAASELPLSALSRWAPLPGTHDPNAAAEVIERVLTAMTAGPGGRRLIVVDDAHLLDKVSAVVVHQLAARDLATLLITVRAGAPVLDAVAALWKESTLTRIDLSEVGEKTVARLLAHALDGQPHPADVHRLYALTGGNMVYLRHLIIAEREAGRFARVAGLWRWQRGPLTSPTLVDVIAGQVDSDMAPVVDTLALIGPRPPELLTRIGPSSDALQAAERRELVQYDRATGLVGLLHPIVGEVRLAVAGEMYLRELRGRLAAALADNSTTVGSRTAAVPADGGPAAAHTTRETATADVMLRAKLTLDSGLAADLGLLLAAAEVAASRCDLPLALRLAQSATDAGGGFGARLMVGYLHFMANQGAEAEAVLAALADEPDLTDGQAGMIAFTRMSNLFWTLQESERARAELNRARTAFPGAAAVIAASESALLCWISEHDGAVRAAETALSDPDLPDTATVFATMALMSSDGTCGRSGRIAQYAARGYAAATGSVSATMRYSVAALHVQALSRAGWVREAIAVADQFVAEDMDAFGEVLPLYVRAYAEFYGNAGQVLTDSFRRVADALAADPSTLPWLELTTRTALAQLQAISGDANAAAETIDWIERHRLPAQVFDAPEIARAQAWTQAAAGNLAHATSMALDAARFARDIGQFDSEVSLLQTALQFGHAAVVFRLDELTAIVDGPRVIAAAHHAHALSENNADELIRCSMHWEAMSCTVVAADAAAQASNIYATRGVRGASALAAARAHRLARQCNAVTPAIAACQPLVHFSKREAQVLGLLAKGLSNRAIAEELFVSVRTVEGHVYRAGTRVGTTTRAELAAYVNGEWPGQDHSPFTKPSS